MLIRSSVLALVAALSLSVSVDSVQAQEIPQPLFGNCCSCSAAIKFRPALDLLKIGARVLPTPTAVIDPVATGMTIDLSNADGGLLSTTIPPGAFVAKNGGQKFIYKNKAARLTGGVVSAVVQERNDQHGGWLISVKELTLGDFNQGGLTQGNV